MNTSHARSGGAVVTGAAGGLGFAISQRLSQRGYQVHLTDVDGDRAIAAAAEIGGSAWGSQLDVTDSDACRTAAHQTADKSGELAVWVNNAGILATRPAWEHSVTERSAMFSVNAEGTMNGTTAALELMRPIGRGHIINIVSLAGLAAAPGQTVYAASKHAALAFSLGTLLDLRAAGVRGIAVSALCPDAIWTPMLHELMTEPHAAPSWIGTMLGPDEVARVAVNLLDRPVPVRSFPRRRGFAARVFEAFPRVALAVAPVVLANARRKQRRFGRRQLLTMRQQRGSD